MRVRERERERNVKKKKKKKDIEIIIIIVNQFKKKHRKKERRIKSQRHLEFPSGLPSKYYPGPTLLNENWCFQHGMAVDKEEGAFLMYCDKAITITFKQYLPQNIAPLFLASLWEGVSPSVQPLQLGIILQSLASPSYYNLFSQCVE